MACGQRQHSTGRRLGSDHPERLGERAGHHKRLRPGQQLSDLVVLESPDELNRVGNALGCIEVPIGRIRQECREDRQRLSGTALQRPTELRDLPCIVQVAVIERAQQTTQPLLVLAITRDLQPDARLLSSNQRPGCYQQIDALGDDQLPDEDDTGAVGRGSCHGIEGPRVDTRRSQASFSLQAGDIRERIPERFRRVAGTDEDAVGGAHALFRVGKEARMRFDRVLQGGAVDLGGEGTDIGAGEDCRAHDQMAGQRGIEAPGRGDGVANRGDVGVDVAVELLVGELREGLDLEALVGVFDIDRQQAVDVGVVDLDPLDLDLAVLAEQMDLVPQARQGTSEIRRVDVAASAAQHVAVEEKDAHSCRASY